MDFGENVCFRNGYGICQDLCSEGVDVPVSHIDLLICNTTSENSLIMKNEAGQLESVEAFKVQSCSEVQVNQYIKYM